MKPVPMEDLSACESAGNVEKLTYRDKFILLYTPVNHSKHNQYLIHGGGGDQYAFFSGFHEHGRSHDRRG